MSPSVSVPDLKRQACRHRFLARYWQIGLLGCLIGLAACSRVPRHGTAFLVEFGTNQLEASSMTTRQDLDRAAKAMRSRLETAGLKSQVERTNSDRLLIKVQTSNTNEVASARELLSRSGRLEFRMVHPESEQLLADGIVAPGYEILRMEIKDGRGKRTVPYLIKKKPERGLTGRYMSRAAVARHSVTDEPQIQFELNPEGGKLFAEITREFAPQNGRYHRLGIVFEGQLYSAPRIDQPIEGGRGIISGASFDANEALALANLLENPLDFPPHIVEERSF
jgi:SecD/SecF fusion protein